jgi:hypothetical protein
MPSGIIVNVPFVVSGRVEHRVSGRLHQVPAAEIVGPNPPRHPSRTWPGFLNCSLFGGLAMGLNGCVFWRFCKRRIMGLGSDDGRDQASAQAPLLPQLVFGCNPSRRVVTKFSSSS